MTSGFGPGRYEIAKLTSRNELMRVFELLGKTFAAEAEPGDSLVIEYDQNTTESALADLLGPLSGSVTGVRGDVDLTDTLTFVLKKRRPLAKDDLEGGGARP